MTKEEIIQNNKMIAEFMGYRYYPHPDKEPGWRKEKGHLKLSGYYLARSHNGLKYHQSWGWIMPVVEKIESIYDDHHGFFGVFISGNSCTIQGTNINKAIAPDSAYGYVYYNNNVDENKFMATYKSVVDFIIWYKKSGMKAGSDDPYKK